MAIIYILCLATSYVKKTNIQIWVKNDEHKMVNDGDRVVLSFDYVVDYEIIFVDL